MIERKTPLEGMFQAEGTTSSKSLPWKENRKEVNGRVNEAKRIR